MAGIYIHIPFCKQACHYCNFHFSTSLQQKDTFIQALCKEIALTPLFNYKEQINTIYFGGGSPSILSIDDLGKIFDALSAKFTIPENIECTLEANPDDITTEKLMGWKKAGINRFSMGIQSFDEKELQWMNRAHNAKEAIACIDKIRDAGFDNFSIDLIYGSPLLTPDKWQQHVQTVIEKKIPHISCYALTVEPKTALDILIKQKKKTPINTDVQAEQFLLLMQWMRDAGYRHYEISNYSLPGHESKHNSSYWKGENYYGFGPSAHAYDGKCRRWNVANNALYIKSLEQNILPFEEEVLTTTQRLNEYIMTSIRTIGGIDLNYLSNTFGEAKKNKLVKDANKWKNKLIFSDNTILLTDEGKLFADGIAADLFAVD